LMSLTILVNAGTLASRVANWLPKLDGFLFQPWGQYKAIKVQHTLVTCDWLKIFFLFQPWLLVWSPGGWFQLLH
jgi:hypothetical protein